VYFLADIRLNGVLTPPIATEQTVSSSKQVDTAESFSDLLNKEIEGGGDIKFSKHAQTRLESRNISLDSNDLSRLSSAVDKAASKGVSDSLVLMDKMAFIVSVPEKTVVTAMPVDEAQENVFTNIDGAVII
jgi:flagellar operon protein